LFFSFFANEELRLKEERLKLIDMMKDTQLLYLGKMTIDQKSYEGRMKTYRERLAEIDDRIITIKAGNAMTSFSRKIANLKKSTMLLLKMHLIKEYMPSKKLKSKRGIKK
jgi:hypothetical protein